MKPTSIRLRLLVGLVVTLVAGAALMGGLAYRSVLHETQALFDYQLRQMALSLRDQGAIDPAQANALRDEDFDVVIQIWTADGRALYATRDHDVLPSRAVLGFADIAAGGREWRTFSVATRDRVIQVAQPARIRSRLAAEAALRSVLPLLAIAPVLAAAMWWLVARGLAPLTRLAQEVQTRGAETLEPLPDADLPDELAPLVQSLNALLARLDASFGTQRAFVADAAHELRSPLTALKLQIDRLKRAPDDASIDALQGGVERAARLVEQLLTLARSEPGAVAPAETLDLGELVRAAVADTVPYALARDAVFELDAEPGVTVTGDRAALTALVRNLADNAVRYGPPAGGRVAVSVKRGDDGAPAIVVDDDGPGIPPADRARVFDRFFRRDSGGPEGSGLGLAIVKAVAERHGASVALGESPAGGLRVTVAFDGATGRTSQTPG